MNATKTTKAGERTHTEEVVAVLNKTFNHRIVRSAYGFQLYGYHGYEGEFRSEVEAKRAYRKSGNDPL